MKKEIHPENYRMVIFHDVQTKDDFLVGSTIPATLTAKWSDGKEYPMVHVEVSSKSHPFYTGDQKLNDTTGRAERFLKRASKAKTESKKA